MRGSMLQHRQQMARMPYKTFATRDSGEISADPNGHPRCPDCDGQVVKCGIDIYKCRKCGEGWTMVPSENVKVSDAPDSAAPNRE
jgi:ribosomal protein L37AE/L43A